MGATVTSTDHLLLHFARNGGVRDGEVEMLVLERGDGVFVVDSLGRRHLDGLSNLFCAQLGYSYGAEMAEVASRQLIELPFATNWGTAHPAAVELAGRLAEIAPGAIDHAFFTNGGSESVEAAWKLVRQYHIANGEPQRTKAIARDRAYHGVTLGALALTGVPGFKEPFGPPAIETFHVSSTNDFRRPESGAVLTSLLLDEINAVIEREGGDTIAMIIAEPVQNAGGCLQPPDGYWPGLREICDRHGILLLADEVITGFGRLGEWFGVTRFGAEPDLITAAKGLTSAYAPMGAVLASERVAAPLYDSGRTLLHGVTFGGHPLSAVIALKNLELFEREQVLDNVRDHEGYLATLLDSLRRLPIVGDVRGSGYFWAIELVPDGPESRFDAEQREELLRRCLPGALIKAELIARGDDRGDTVIQIAPPLICDRPILDDLVGRLGDVMVTLSEHMGIPSVTVSTPEPALGTGADAIVGHWIDGAEVKAAQRFGDVFDPATGSVQRRVAFADSEDVDRAVRSARAAFESWSQTSLARRTAVLFRFRELLAEHADGLAAIVTSEHGKTLVDAAGELQRGLEVVEFACGLAHLLKGEASEQISTLVDSTSYRQPLGVAVGITPFNFPSMVPLWMFPISLACGNTFILKPSERDPSASLFLARLIAEAGLPAGVLSVIQGDREAVDALLTHPGVDAVSFVGSTPIARHVFETGTAHGKRVQALGGAKNHAIVMPDADLETAADAVASAAFGSAGQRCMAISTVVAVGGDTGDALVREVVERGHELVIGPGSDAESQMGPLITAQARDRVADYVERGEQAGATVALDGRERFADDEPGFFIGPSVLDNVTTEMDVYRDEVFGPLLVVLRAESFEEALEIVNSNPYGNGAAIFTNDGGVAREFRSRVTAGMVGINVPIPVPTAPFSFGGWKDSLFGDLHVYGREGVLFNTRAKVVTERWPQKRSTVDYGFPSHK